jgi:hypothetical protein
MRGIRCSDRRDTARDQKTLDGLRERYDTAVSSGVIHNRLRTPCEWTPGRLSDQPSGKYPDTLKGHPAFQDAPTGLAAGQLTSASPDRRTAAMRRA